MKMRCFVLAGWMQGRMQQGSHRKPEGFEEKHAESVKASNFCPVIGYRAIGPICLFLTGLNLEYMAGARDSTLENFNRPLQKVPTRSTRPWCWIMLNKFKLFHDISRYPKSSWNRCRKKVLGRHDHAMWCKICSGSSVVNAKASCNRVGCCSWASWMLFAFSSLSTCCADGDPVLQWFDQLQAQLLLLYASQGSSYWKYRFYTAMEDIKYKCIS